VSFFPDPNHLSETAPAAILDAVAHGRLGFDHRALKTLLAKPNQTIEAFVAFWDGDRADDIVDLQPELVALIRHFHAKSGLPILMKIIQEKGPELPDELVETVVSFGPDALEPLLTLHAELDETDGSEVAFMLASLGVRDERIFNLLTDHLQYDARDGAFLLGLYGHIEALPKLEALVGELKPEESEVRREVLDAIEQINSGKPTEAREDEFDIFDLYPEEESLPVELLTEDERIELLDHSLPALRAAAAHSFFNRELEQDVQKKLLHLGETDSDVEVRARAWETLMDATDDTDVVEAMLKVMRDPGTPIEERAGVLVGLSPEADRNEVRQAMEELYKLPESRSKALEAMWRSVHPSFRDYFPKHLSDPDLETRRNAIWGVGYHSIRSEMDKLRGFFEDDDLRMDALFAYAMTLPGEVSPARMKAMLSRVEKDAKGLSEEEEILVMAALDERLVLAGKKPYFAGKND
jgi:HEAT repeat protein